MSGFDLTREEREKLRIFQAERVVMGHCPECSAVIVILNDREVWPPAICRCGWADGTTALLNHVRYESGLVAKNEGIVWRNRRVETDEG